MGSGGKRVKTKRQRIFTVGIAGFSLLAVGVFLLVAQPPCLIHRVTGYLCPACGTTRILSALLHLDFAAALQLDRFMQHALPLAALGPEREAVRYIQGKKPLLYRRWAVALWAAVLCIAVAFAVWRNFPVA